MNFIILHAIYKFKIQLIFVELFALDEKVVSCINGNVKNATIFTQAIPHQKFALIVKEKLSSNHILKKNLFYLLYMMNDNFVFSK